MKKFITISVVLFLCLGLALLIVLSKLKQVSKIGISTKTTSNNSEVKTIKSLPPPTGINCNQYNDKAWQADCQVKLATIYNASDEKSCEQLPQSEEKTQCLIAKVIKKAAAGDLSVCNGLKADKDKNRCLAQASLSLAISRRDSSWCNKIANKEDMAFCKMNLGTSTAAIATTTPKK
ncbi:MAG: hypothetical protein WCK11_05435 [Candidatus Falkowbacteria bacterium]